MFCSKNLRNENPSAIWPRKYLAFAKEYSKEKWWLLFFEIGIALLWPRNIQIQGFGCIYEAESIIVGDVRF